MSAKNINFLKGHMLVCMHECCVSSIIINYA